MANRLKQKLPVKGRLRTDLAAVSVVPVRRSKVLARAIVEAPSHLGLRAAGVERLPEALLAVGLAERLGARRGTRLALRRSTRRSTPPPACSTRTGSRDFARRLADAVGAVLDAGAFPLVLGGDCSILLGNTLALRRRGRYGLLFLDGHADFYQPSAEPTGEAASMELALATGRGPDLVPTSRADGPLLRDEDVVAFGFRDADEAPARAASRCRRRAARARPSAVGARRRGGGPRRRWPTSTRTAGATGSGSTSTPTCSTTP